jgi:hypothetical protein
MGVKSSAEFYADPELLRKIRKKLPTKGLFCGMLYQRMETPLVKSLHCKQRVRWGGGEGGVRRSVSQKDGR